ncbi:DUF308 domain-containing protein [Bradyrhizobium sp. BR 10261]|uniref:DUF308 domain-containing protein n=1 Tax=Bradyrhizobium sp. BR 10261 TaxID=2749992 RepID=UPI001C648FE8|nr:DUF308 domain-containing protein [Bradyrhizobium sp. BR 10261]MBW7964316.1 DUF308 domain-containing protein [Bradyrhizobium sp. BR 10261]
MSVALLIAGIFAILAGLLAIAFGYSIRDFSLGSTLITSGTIGVCSGMLLIGLYVVLLELRAIARRLAGAAAASEVRVRPVLPPGLASPNGLGASVPEPAPAMRVESPPSPAAPPTLAAPPWQAEAAARPRVEPPAEPEAPPLPSAAPETPRKRNLLFASSSRKERERAEAKAAESAPPQASPAPAEPAAPDAPHASFDDAWPKPDRARPPEPPVARRPPPPPPPPRPSSTFEPAAPQPTAASPASEPPAEQPQVTVLKSGIVDGMAYSLYSDGSIEAQMPEGMMRFASIDELRAHLDQRGG